MRKYRDTILNIIISIPIHVPVMFLFIMVMAGGIQEIRNKFTQYMVIILCIIIELMIHSKMITIINKKRNNIVNKNEVRVSKIIILISVIIAYCMLFFAPIIFN